MNKNYLKEDKIAVKNRTINIKRNVRTVESKLAGFRVNRILLMVLLTILILFILILPNVFAIGISPAATTIDFEAGLEKTYSFSVVNSENKDTSIVLYVQGELSNYIELSHTSDFLSSGDSAKQYSFTLKLPDTMDAGLKEGEIVVMDIPQNAGGGGTNVNAKVALVHQVHVNVPYPGQFIDVRADIIAGGEMTKFIIPIRNKGTEKIQKASADIEIFLSGEKIDSIKTNEIDIRAGEEKELYAEWKPSKIGEYLARINIKYDGSEKTIEKEFEVGETLIKIEDIRAENFQLGEVAKFELTLNNEWSENVRDVYVKMQFFKDGNLIEEAKTPTQDIASGRVEKFNAFFDTSGIEAGTYDVKIILNYNGKSSERETTAEITDNSIVVFGFGGGVKGERNWMMIGFIILGVLVVGNIAWFIFLRKKFMKKK